MANTRDSLGEQATLDGLVARSLTDFEENGVTTLRNYALYNNTKIETLRYPALTNTGIYSHQGCTELTSVSMPVVTTIGNYAFSGCTRLETVTAPSVKTINQYAFQNCRRLNSVDTSEVTTIGNYAFDATGVGVLTLPSCTSLGTYTGKGTRMTTIDITNNITINGNKFNGASALTHLILRSPTMCTLSATSAFTGTAIANGIGYIYVPTDLVDTYKAASNWSTYASQIVSIDEYPKALQIETITDSWADIAAAISNGTYSTRYSVGDVKCVYLGGSYIPMQIVGFDLDTKTSGGTAPISWVGYGLFDTQWMNPTNTTAGGWADCDLRDYLRNKVYYQLDADVRSMIVPVDKTYKTTSGTSTVSDTLWIPSAREIFGGTSYENSGAVYTGLFADATSRIKRNGCSSTAADWWLRSAYSATSFYYVNFGGNVNLTSASNTYGVALGFCT